jgi:hypothetical protein
VWYKERFLGDLIPSLKFTFTKYNMAYTSDLRVEKVFDVEGFVALVTGGVTGV